MNDSIEEPGIMMSPKVAAYSEACFWASELSWDDVSGVVSHILWVTNREHDYTDEGHDRYMFMIERAIFFARRINKKHKLNQIPVDL